MIKNKNRNGWFGASDTAMIVGNWETETFKNWWSVKLGLTKNNINTWAMECGNLLEIPIIKKIEKIENRKIKLGKRPFYNFHLRLRVNYDGFTKNEVVEIKTTSKLWKAVPKNYWQQCQVLMYRKKKLTTLLYAYLMEESDYLNPYFPEIDSDRIHIFPVFYDREFIEQNYLPKLKYLAKCLKKKNYPTYNDFLKEQKNERI